MSEFEKENLNRIISKMKEIIGENNYKLALAITGHRPGKIRDITLSSADGELLLKYIDFLERELNNISVFRGE